MRIITVFLAALLLSGIASICSADWKFNPVLVYQGSIESNSFNISIHKGVERFEQKTGYKCTEVVTSYDIGEYVECIGNYTEQGYSPVFMLYGNHFPGLVDFVRRYPTTRFIVLDTVRDEPNMFSFVLAEHEGSFLAGVLAAKATKSNILGFISVVDTPFQRRFLCGYRQGAKYVNPDIEILEGFTGDYPGSWFDGNATAALANRMMDNGADVIFQAAGGAGPAVLKAAAARGRLGIGVDINQNGLYPGSVLTSMVKRTDQAVFAALMLARRGIWRDNYKRLGLAQGAVGLVFDENNSGLVTPEMRSYLQNVRNDIVFGRISVHDYTEDEVCP
ncbi:BMP family ABC transporter substrate-binding protein [Maridesulfovibrio sp. FT414]|uniref:BMP family ABC transporter substrate-binding protein n=1 Tax=Maridesulfovibrio sp. FT414 TaxID=2979469 RepID=UPI003D809001